MRYTEIVKPPDTRQLNLNVDIDLLERIERYRHKRMFPTKKDAVLHLLRFALQANPPREWPAKTEKAE